MLHTGRTVLISQGDLDAQGGLVMACVQIGPEYLVWLIFLKKLIDLIFRAVAGLQKNRAENREFISIL